jgi:hypothetical protein
VIGQFLRRRRATAPLGLLAALALAAGGSSSPWLIDSLPGSAPRHPAAAAPMPVHLEHLELVALRAQSIATEAPAPAGLATTD